MKKNAVVRTGTSVAEILERVLDHGLVIDAWMQVSVVGLKLIDVDARVVVASISGYVRHARAVSEVPTVSRPRVVPVPARPRLLAERARKPQGARTRPRRLGRCASGCTFLERFRGPAPTVVRCPYRPGEVCEVTPA